MPNDKRRAPLETYVFFFVVFALLQVLIHTPLLKLPFFWDEVGQFIPAALDILHAGSWIPHSALPNAHPPTVMAFLAGVWFATGYSIAATRVAMLLVSAAGLLVAFLLAIWLSANLPGKPAFAVVLLLIFSPLYYAQSMLALLDLPAMLFTCLALLLFLQQRTPASAAACVALVLVKETGIIVPVVFIGWLAWERRWREAAYFLAPVVVLAAWLVTLRVHTGNLLGNPQFAHRNLLFLLHPVRFPLALVRRLYYLFIADFHWIGTLAIGWAVRRTQVFRTRDWGVAGSIFAAHVIFFSLFGWATLERYLLPVLPILYSAMLAGFSTLPRRWTLVAECALAIGLVASNFWNPPYPFPLENNLAFIDFVDLQKEAAQFIQYRYPHRRVLSAWPFGSAVARPDFGYVERGFVCAQIPDFRAATLAMVNWSNVEVFVLYSRNWDPDRNLLRIPIVRELWARYYGYQPDLVAPEIETGLKLEQVGHWERRGQWIDVYAVTNRPQLITGM